MWRNYLAWTIDWETRAFKDFQKLDKIIQKKILKYLKERVLLQKDPRAFGKGLAYDKVGLWRYRVENYRIVCQIEDDKLIILIILVSHRKDVYS